MIQRFRVVRNGAGWTVTVLAVDSARQHTVHAIDSVLTEASALHIYQHLRTYYVPGWRSPPRRRPMFEVVGFHHEHFRIRVAGTFLLAQRYRARHDADLALRGLVCQPPPTWILHRK